MVRQPELGKHPINRPPTELWGSGLRCGRSIPAVRNRPVGSTSQATCWTRCPRRRRVRPRRRSMKGDDP